ncbi:endoribonuclease YBEY, chloroplastic [Beta vulgaris subsp. vulgaris]|uniref:endoribonuclease YBEY, chloroplastic n=1 Tax=Beta vulgaris subsp. vulgaris TaxID=3555 RepID=UPI0005402855|nr:endoribonuclease YBEY, chloroplastic [Beta vulgaris subsp. vulgaris]
MLSSTTHHLHCLLKFHPISPSSPMARAMTRALPLSLKPTFSKPRFLSFSPTHMRVNPSFKPSLISGLWVGNEFGNGGDFRVLGGLGMRVCCGGGGFGGGERGYRKVRKKFVKSKRKVKDLELSVKILIEEGLPNDPEVLSIAEMLRLNAPMAMKLAFDGLKNPEHKTRDTTINDVACFETIELSLLLCNDEFIRKLNKEWRDEDHATDVLSMSQHIPELKLPILMLGDIVISIETAARQAEERGHTLLDEIRILLVHGLLHLLGFDHELSEEAEAEMEKEEELLLNNLGWQGKGLIRSACDAVNDGSLHVKDPDDRKKEGSLRFYRPKFKYIFCDMDGTLLNSKSQISSANANALREALSRGVQVVIATGKARPGAINVLKTVDLVGRDGVVSESSPGVFLQGLLVYGIQGREIFRRSLDPNVCREAFAYSQEHHIPLVAFCGDRCLTLFDHPLVDSLHDIYHEPKAETIPSVGQLLAAAEVQKLVFLDTAERVTTSLRPYWSEASGDHASVVQTVPDMLELVPDGTSKGNGVKLLLDHLGVTSNEIMAIGDGENDIEMLELANFGIALSNGSEKTKDVADVIGLSNDEDGVADAIYRYAF